MIPNNTRMGKARRLDGEPHRVVLIHPAAGVNWSGGAETFSIELSRHLSPYFDVELLSGGLCNPFSHPVSGIPRNYTYNLLHHPLTKPLWSKFVKSPEIWLEHLASFVPCVSHMLQHPADLIFPCNEVGGLAVASTVRSLTKTPVLYTEHGSLIEGGYHLSRNLKFQPDRLVVFSETVSKFVQELRPEQAVSIIPNGVDLQRFTPEGETIDLGLAGPVVLCVSSLGRTGYKRTELIIQAMSRLPHASLLICGNGPDRGYFQTLGDTLLGPERFAIRTFPFDEMPKVYRSADVFTLPSLDEPCALAYLEAMASGLPVVTTDDEMRRHTIADAGIACDVTNAEIYAEALTEVLQAKPKAKARRNALRFGWDTIAVRYREVIEETIALSRGDHEPQEQY
jgi:glycosyltransferase involved in cell wall biosynthesis